MNDLPSSPEGRALQVIRVVWVGTLEQPKEGFPINFRV